MTYKVTFEFDTLEQMGEFIQLQKTDSHNSPQECLQSGDVVKSGQTYSSPTEDTIQSKHKAEINKDYSNG